VADFVVEDDKGTPTIVEDTSQASPKYSASSWFTLFSERVTIAKNDKVVVLAHVKVPPDAKPGGRYAAIYFEPSIGQKLTEEAGANTTPRIASLMYIRVNGPISEYALISDMVAKSFYENGPIDVTAQIMNKGDYHIRPKGTFTLYDSFGAQVDQKKIKEANIFPDAQYTFAAAIGQKWMMGKYKITLNAIYGAGEQAVERSLFVWVFPWRIVTITLLSILIIIIVGKYAYSNFFIKKRLLRTH